MNYTKFKLANGLKVLVVPIRQVQSATLTVWVKTGSRLEAAGVAGISHFLEHMFFKGSLKRPTAKDISTAVDSMGGEFNAATSKDWTNFYIKTRAANLEASFDVLSDMLLNPLLKKEEIEREKGVIIEEMAMYEDTPTIKISDVFENLAFAPNSLSKDIIGEQKTVRGITRDDFLSYIKRYYYPENMLITVSGGVGVKTVRKLCGKYFSRFGKEGGGEVKYENFVPKQKKPGFKLVSKKKEQAHFILGFLGMGRDYGKRYEQAVLSAVLGGGMSSRLFIEVRERRGLAYAVRTSTERFSETGYMGTYAGVDVKKAEEAIKVILDQYFGLAEGRYPISEGELKKAKEYIKGHLALSFEDTKDINGIYGESELFLGKTDTLDEYFAKIDAVDIEGVGREAKLLFKPGGLNLAVIGPYNNPESFERIIQRVIK